MRVALATTHLPLADVPAAITPENLVQTLRILYNDLRHRFGLDSPRIAVLGLNPHAGENGHLGREEIDIITPSIEALRGEGLLLEGPLPADTAFLPSKREQVDAYLAMYHDQGLPVLKALGFGDSVNVTLGLPYVRTSVDHGTALIARRHRTRRSGEPHRRNGNGDGDGFDFAVTLTVAPCTAASAVRRPDAASIPAPSRRSARRRTAPARNRPHSPR